MKLTRKKGRSESMGAAIRHAIMPIKGVGTTKNNSKCRCHVVDFISLQLFSRDINKYVILGVAKKNAKVRAG